MTKGSMAVWTGAIIIYYIVATVLPVDKLIGKIYPVFGATLLIMAVGLCSAMFIGHTNGTMPMMELTLTNLHPAGLNVFPFLFTTIACGALSGFHATQSPMMARCVKRESEAKRVFYGSMVVEGIVALIWCAVTIAFFGNTGAISEALSTSGGASGVVNIVSKELLGTVGAILAVLGVVACPITSGDTAFRSARLTIADAFGIKQKAIKNRFMLALPLFAICIVLTQIDFNIIWRYFAWSNQTLATIFLWTGSAFLLKNKKNHWITTLPATLMTYVVISYILQEPEGFRLPTMPSNIVGIVGAAAIFVLFMLKANNKEA